MRCPKLTCIATAKALPPPQPKQPLWDGIARGLTKSQQDQQDVVELPNTCLVLFGSLAVARSLGIRVSLLYSRQGLPRVAQASLVLTLPLSQLSWGRDSRRASPHPT